MKKTSLEQIIDFIPESVLNFFFGFFETIDEEEELN
jgi:hypothetical protein